MRKNPWSECPFLWIALDSSVFSEIEIIKDASINAVSFSQFKYSWPGAVIFISWPVYFLVVMMTLDVRQCVDMCTMKHVFYQFCRLVYCLLFIYSILCCVANGPNFFVLDESNILFVLPLPLLPLPAQSSSVLVGQLIADIQNKNGYRK